MIIGLLGVKVTVIKTQQNSELYKKLSYLLGRGVNM